jgi:hypothetical protein
MYRISQYYRLNYSTAQHVKEVATASTTNQRETPLIFDNRGPSLHDFIRNSQLNLQHPSKLAEAAQPETVPYLEPPSQVIGAGAKYYIEVYGCQMNFNDTEVLMAVMNKAGYQRTEQLEDADIVFLVTVSIQLIET